MVDLQRNLKEPSGLGSKEQGRGSYSHRRHRGRAFHAFGQRRSDDSETGHGLSLEVDSDNRLCTPLIEVTEVKQEAGAIILPDLEDLEASIQAIKPDQVEILARLAKFWRNWERSGRWIIQ